MGFGAEDSPIIKTNCVSSVSHFYSSQSGENAFWRPKNLPKALSSLPPEPFGIFGIVTLPHLANGGEVSCDFFSVSWSGTIFFLIAVIHSDWSLVRGFWWAFAIWNYDPILPLDWFCILPVILRCTCVFTKLMVLCHENWEYINW